MPFYCIRDDITNLHVGVDVIVNSANKNPKTYSGVDWAIYHASENGELLYEMMDERKAIGYVEPGEVCVTNAYGLLRKQGIRHIVHAVAPRWEKGDAIDFDIVEETVASCYRNSLHNDTILWSRMALPLISTGVFGFPKSTGLHIAISEITGYLLEHDPAGEKTVYLVLYDDESISLASNLLEGVQEYIDKDYTASHLEKQYPSGSMMQTRGESPTSAAGKGFDKVLQELISVQSAKLSTKREKKYFENSRIYARALLNRQTYLKIYNGHSTPTKSNAIAIAFALELNVAQTKRLVRASRERWNDEGELETIVLPYIKTKNYDLYEVNDEIFTQNENLPMLGSNPDGIRSKEDS